MLWDDYCNNLALHITNSDNIFYNVFADALRIQAERVIKNIMKANQCNRKEARRLAFPDMGEENE